ncbi:MAG: hypothetical protein LBH00_05020, partial [Planctomycetaceae bacterium]|jgi:hypothetical protein|nr:hypothetical protein [Planctomycetaceae bacterium]
VPDDPFLNIQPPPDLPKPETVHAPPSPVAGSKDPFLNIPLLTVPPQPAAVMPVPPRDPFLQAAQNPLPVIAALPKQNAETKHNIKHNILNEPLLRIRPSEKIYETDTLTFSQDTHGNRKDDRTAATSAADSAVIRILPDTSLSVARGDTGGNGMLRRIPASGLSSAVSNPAVVKRLPSEKRKETGIKSDLKKESAVNRQSRNITENPIRLDRFNTGIREKLPLSPDILVKQRDLPELENRKPVSAGFDPQPEKLVSVPPRRAEPERMELTRITAPHAHSETNSESVSESEWNSRVPAGERFKPETAPDVLTFSIAAAQQEEDSVFPVVSKPPDMPKKDEFLPPAAAEFVVPPPDTAGLLVQTKPVPKGSSEPKEQEKQVAGQPAGVSAEPVVKNELAANNDIKTENRPLPETKSSVTEITAVDRPNESGQSPENLPMPHSQYPDPFLQQSDPSLTVRTPVPSRFSEPHLPEIKEEKPVVAENPSDPFAAIAESAPVVRFAPPQMAAAPPVAEKETPAQPPVQPHYASSEPAVLPQIPEEKAEPMPTPVHITQPFAAQTPAESSSHLAAVRPSENTATLPPALLPQPIAVAAREKNYVAPENALVNRNAGSTAQNSVPNNGIAKAKNIENVKPLPVPAAEKLPDISPQPEIVQTLPPVIHVPSVPMSDRIPVSAFPIAEHQPSMPHTAIPNTLPDIVNVPERREEPRGFATTRSKKPRQPEQPEHVAEQPGYARSSR